MALAPSVAKLVQDAEAALAALLAADAIPAIEGELNSLLPAGALPIALSLEAASLSMAQAALASLVAKIVPPAPAA